jgi:hypothetical protein
MTQGKRPQVSGSTGGEPPGSFDRRRLSVASLGLDDRTILRAYANPREVRESTLVRLRRAARELGLPEPGETEAPSEEPTEKS